MIEIFTKDNFMDIISRYSDYRKCFGLLTAWMCDLPIVKEGFVVAGEYNEEIIDNWSKKNGSIIMCRPDAPKNSWHNLPRGRDIVCNQLKSQYQLVKKETTGKTILLCFQHPSIYFSGKFVERWKINGGANILILWKNKVVIEFVGRGFDVGDLSRGMISPHQSIVIPWSFLRLNMTSMWDQVNKSTIDPIIYKETRDQRMEFLSNSGYNTERIQVDIPKEYTNIGFNQFKVIITECIKPVISKKNMFVGEAPITILLNFYEDKPHVFEIWESDR